MKAIIVVSHGSAPLIDQNYDPQQLADRGLRLFIVDNVKTPQDSDDIAAYARRARCHVVSPGTNGGFGAGINAGVKAAVAMGAKSLVFANPDVCASAETMEELAALVERNPQEIVAPVLTRPDGSVWFDGASLHRVSGRASHQVVPGQMAWLTMALMGCSVQAWKAVGGVDEDYFMYWEDVDFSVRASRAGFGLQVVTGLSAVHDVGATEIEEVRRKSPSYIYHQCRNRMVFAHKLMGPASASAWSDSAWEFAREVLLRSGSRKSLAHPPSMRAAITGTLDGLRWTDAVRRASRDKPVVGVG